MNSRKNIFQICLVLFAISVLQACAINEKKWSEKGQVLFNNFNKKSLTTNDIENGLKQALKISSERVVSQLGKKNGYLNDKAIHIILPNEFQSVHHALKQVGLGKYTAELEVKMNRAAEIAAPKAKKLFWKAIKEMRWQDVNAIYKGNDDAATQYFKKKMTPSLNKMMWPLINKTLADVGVVKVYSKILNKYHSLPYVPKVQSDLTNYVMQKSIHGIFYYLAKEEAAIRKDPAKRTTALLKRLFEK